eukprot:TRINITY_DN23684_c0_g1_i1.p1 TRINITY_DN23684_c0_g1~~TRINITY_DN23684_c0_g1_i1.p1  ORF type:complete len:782 (-),score=214.29 TRINITY_DN23684_c0_g1_i1:84-2429(-)
MATTQTFRPRNPVFTPQSQGVPLLPGNNFHDHPIVRGSLHKAQYLRSVNSAPMVMTLSMDGYAPQPPKRMDIPPRAEPGEEYTPPWLTQDVVLQFTAYYKEHVVENAIEAVRINRVVIYYHTEDRTVLVRSIPQHNSGINPGVLVRRHRIPKQAGDGFVELTDLYIGAELAFYGKTFRIVGCDEATRRYLEEKGVPVGPEEGFPEADDAFAQYNTRKRMIDMKPRKELGPTDMELKRHHEYGNTGRVSKPTPVSVMQAQQFYANDGKFLSFLAIWDDRDKPHGDVHRVRINYYLADNTVEVVEPTAVSMDRERASKMMLRQRVPAPPRTMADRQRSLLDHMNKEAIQHSTFGVHLATGYLAPEDLGVGRVVPIHNREYFLYDCSPWTRDWYATEKGVTMLPPQDVDKKYDLLPKKMPRAAPPPHDGIGTEEDSLGNWQNLILRPTQTRNFTQWVQNSGMQLKFILRMVRSPTATIEEDGRHFLLTYHLEDDTLQIDEIGIKNSGIVGGRFLRRQKVKKQLPDGTYAFFKADDFQLGETVEILSRKFEIMHTDSRSEKILAGEEPTTSIDEIKQLIVQLREVIALRFPRTTEAFRRIAGESTGAIDLDGLCGFFRSMNILVRREDAMTILNKFDLNKNGMLEYNEFVQMVAGDDFSHNLDVTSNSVRGVKLSPEDQVSAEVAEAASFVAREQKVLRKVVLQLRDKILQRRIDTIEVYRLMNAMSTDAMLHVENFRRGVREILHLLLSPYELHLLCEHLFPGGRPCTLEAFSNLLEGVSPAVQ